MKHLFAGILLGACTLALAGPAPAAASAAAGEGAPKVRLVVSKGKHEMTLYEGEQKGETFKVALGPGGAGHKQREGDKVTPVGRYHIIAKQPSQDFRTFLRLDYPNADDRKRFAELKKAGALPKGATIGGDIGIHGAPRAPEWKDVHKKYDWTWGCVALDDQEIDRLAKKVPVGTVVDIED